MNSFSEIFSCLQSRDSKKRMVAAWGVDEHTISAASQAIDLGLVEVILVGDRAMIEDVCRQENITPSKFTRDPDFKSDDWHRCLHYHLGYIIDEITHDILGNEGNHGYDIEIVIKRKS